LLNLEKRPCGVDATFEGEKKLYEYFVKFITLETKDVTIFSKK
jgi:hypothetical protein